MRTKVFSWIAVVGSVVVACSSLPDIPRGTCGNHVLEANEDCDTSLVSASGAVCRPPTSAAGACRFDCTRSAEGTRPPCPSGWGCSAVDGICRTASGRFAPSGTRVPSAALGIMSADYDADGIADLRETSSNDVRVRYGDPSGVMTQVFQMSTPGAHPAAGPLSNDPQLDLAMVSRGGVALWRGGTDRTFAPTAAQSLGLAPTPTAAFVFADVLRADPGLEVVTLVGNTFSVRAGFEIDSTRVQPLFPTIGQTAADLVGPLVAARLNEDPVLAPCDEILYAFKNSPTVNIFQPCTGDVPNTTPPLAKPPGAFTLPVNVRNFFARDLNGDGHLDLAVIGDEGGLFIGVGNGDGTMKPAFPIPATFDLKLVPLDVAFITNDDLADLVASTGILLNVPGPGAPPRPTGDGGSDAGATPPGDAGRETTVIPAPPGVVWTEARVVDLNRDGRPDVVAASAHRLDVYLNAGGRLLNLHSFDLIGSPSYFAFGDFDGDLVLDIAFRERFDDKSPDAVTIAFGTPTGVPEAPSVQARVGSITALSAGPLSAYGNRAISADGIADIGALATSPDGAQYISILSGSSDRLLQSPFVLTRPRRDLGNAKVSSDAVAFAIGQFTQDPHRAVAAVAYEVKDAMTSTNTVSAWLIPVNGDAQINVSNISISTTPLDTYKVDPIRRTPQGGLSWQDERAEMVAIDLDPASPNGFDEVVLFVPPIAETSTGKLFVLRSDGTTFTADPNPVAIGLAPGLGRWSLRRADMDADGAMDVLVTYNDQKGFHGRVYLNTRTGKVDASPVSVDAPPGTRLIAMAPLNLDDDPELELALLTDKGVFVAKRQGAAFAIGAPAQPVSGLPAGSSIAAGDMNGDGVDDLAVVSAGILQVFRGLPELQ